MEENVKIEKLEETQNVKKKNNKGLVIVIILFALIILGLIGYICYDKGIIFNKSEISSTETETEKKSTSTKEENLDINSRPVQYLYNLVSNDTDSYTWMNGWEFWSNNSNTRETEFDITTATEKVKMKLVTRNLKESNREELLTCDSNIPDIQQDGKHSQCYLGNIHNQYYPQYAYSKSYVESVYKELFGRDYKLDTSVSISIDNLGISQYYYNNKIDKYVLYSSIGGVIGGPGGEKYTLASAKKIDNKIIITQNVEKYGEEKLEETYKYIYTFEVADDGMYKFISRVKEK